MSHVIKAKGYLWRYCLIETFRSAWELASQISQLRGADLTEGPDYERRHLLLCSSWGHACVGCCPSAMSDCGRETTSGLFLGDTGGTPVTLTLVPGCHDSLTESSLDGNTSPQPSLLHCGADLHHGLRALPAFPGSLPIFSYWYWHLLFRGLPNCISQSSASETELVGYVSIMRNWFMWLWRLSPMICSL